jgi:uncharacterized membrane protein YkvI
MVGYFATALAIFGIANATDQGAIVAIGIVLVVLIAIFALMLFSALIGLFVSPLMLRAGVTSKIDEAFKFSWASEFAGKVWQEYIVAMLIWYVLTIIGTFVGFAVLCVGVYPVVAISYLAWCHLMFQIYRVYLSKGGEPIPLPPIGAAPKAFL